MSQYLINKMEQAPNRHMIILLLSAAFILAQFIVEIIIVSFLINIIPSTGTFLYAHQWIFGIVHMIFTVILLWFAGKCGDNYCSHFKKN